jgi:Kef-type K+ transport system membrane component KefB
VLRSREGQIVIGAAVLDDIPGIVLLAVVAFVAGSGSVALQPILMLVLSRQQLPAAAAAGG